MGGLLRVRQYAGGGALWLDELGLARNIVERPLGALLRTPLASDQVAPPGFLLLEKLAAFTLGSGEWQLRLVPLAGALVALALFTLVAARVLDRVGRLAAVALFVVNVPQVWHAAEVTPYATDVATALALTLLAMRWQERGRRRDAVILALAGAAGVWLSLPAVPVLAGLGGALGVATWARRDGKAGTLVPVALVWALRAAAPVAAAFHQVSPASHAYLRVFWAAGFPPAGATPSAWRRGPGAPCAARSPWRWDTSGRRSTRCSRHWERASLRGVPPTI